MVRTGAFTDSKKAPVADADALSVTLMVRADELTVVGVPDMIPRVRLIPGGSDPLARDQV
jgi:hypothetical protein